MGRTRAEHLPSAVVASLDGVPPGPASAGVCTCDGVGLVAGDLSRLADECLYEAKRAGRDTVRACGRPVGDR
ncbi:MAG TPA: hypothetical protein VHM89_02730 [Acidimicrobiales bacterium]|nr:hypothetical protein [Acidimicrobiales bacterium]